MSIDYASEKLSNAVDALATSAKPIQKRLEYAALACHTLLSPNDTGFPNSEIAEQFKRWFRRITSRAAVGSEGSIVATTSALSDEDAMELAKELFSIFVKVERAYTLKYADDIRRELST